MLSRTMGALFFLVATTSRHSHLIVSTKVVVVVYGGHRGVLGYG